MHVRNLGLPVPTEALQHSRENSKKNVVTIVRETIEDGGHTAVSIDMGETPEEWVDEIAKEVREHGYQAKVVKDFVYSPGSKIIVDWSGEKIEDEDEQ